MEIRSSVKAWQPPQSYIAEGPGMNGAPPMAIEWNVEARAGGVCVVRVVHSLFASTDEWDDQLEATKVAWPGFFRTLHLYLAHFRGQRSENLHFVAPVAGTEAEAWEALTSALGQKGLKVGQRFSAPPGVPALSGHAKYLSENPYDALLLLEQPGPGVAALGTFHMGGDNSMVVLGFYLYGDDAPETAAREQPIWQNWFQERFPMPSQPGHGG
jgi:hypothetical protein